MRILIDECLPHQIRSCLTSHDARTVQFAGLGGYENGALLKIGEAEYDVFLTSDKNLRYQQNLHSRKLAILLLSTNDLMDILEASSRILEAIDHLKPGVFVELEI